MFHSTRGNKKVSSYEAILNGLADDGGLYIIDELPKIDYHDLLNDDYQTMAAKILHAFFDDFSYADIKKEIDEAYSTFDTKNVVEIKKCDNSYFLELFHGPTLAFKDLALVVLPRLMKLSKKKANYEKNITILTATSGDTGGAALNGFKDIDGISIVVLYPNGGVSTVQEAQMNSFKSDNAKPIAINGNFDDCQSFVKKFFKSHKDLSLSSANSINIARLIPQVVYYFYSYIHLVKMNEIKLGEKINFDVPTGNFGNIFAGFYAKKLGLPIDRLIVASNKNDVLTDFFLTGTYNKLRPFFKTNSPSMDILISSNLERLVYYANNEDTTKTKQLMDKLQSKGEYDLKNPFNYFYASSCNENRTLEVINEVYSKYSYLIDPHTAVAYDAYLNFVKDTNNKNKTVVISTASIFKFPQSVLEAFGIIETDGFKAIDILSKKFNLEVPSVLNYPKFERTVVEKDILDDYIKEVILCFK
jgi:threonine synthase